MLKLEAQPGFEPGSRGYEPHMLPAYTTAQSKIHSSPVIATDDVRPKILDLDVKVQVEEFLHPLLEL